MAEDVEVGLAQLLAAGAYDEVATRALDAYGDEVFGFLIHHLGSESEATEVYAQMAEDQKDPSFVLADLVEFVMIQSHLFLGLALEQRGDASGACGEYARVLERWGTARPRSVTADAAREHATSLGCEATRAN